MTHGGRINETAEPKISVESDQPEIRYYFGMVPSKHKMKIHKNNSARGRYKKNDSTCGGIVLIIGRHRIGIHRRRNLKQLPPSDAHIKTWLISLTL